MKLLKGLRTRFATHPATSSAAPLVTPTPGNPATDPDYPGRYHPSDHQLPAPVPDSADVLLWVEQCIEDHAQAGSLDEGTPFILDSEIEARLEQWLHAVDQWAWAIRARTGLGIRADQARELVIARERLAHARREVSRLEETTNHFAGILDGHPVTVSPKESLSEIPRPGSQGLKVAELETLSGLELLLQTQARCPRTPHRGYGVGQRSTPADPALWRQP